VSSAVVVVGYLHDMIERTIGPRHEGLEVTYVRNERYATTGSMYSLSCAREAVAGDDIVLLESDLLFDAAALTSAIRAPHANVLLAAPASGSGDEVYLCADEEGRLIDLGKQLPGPARRRAVGELVGISRFSASFMDVLFDRADAEYGAGQVTRHYEETVLAVSRRGVPVHVVVCEGLIWTEIDKPADLERARRDILPRLRERSAGTVDSGVVPLERGRS